MSVFFPLSSNVLPYKIRVKKEFVNSSNLQSILYKVYLSSLNIGQWRRKCEVNSISKPQLQIGFKPSWNLCLNLCSRKWLRPTRNPLIILIPLWLSKTLLGEGLIKFRILFLKTTKLFKFRRVGSKFFHSLIVEGKKEFLKKLCLMLKKGILSTFLVAYAWFFSGISLKRYWGLLLL